MFILTFVPLRVGKVAVSLPLLSSGPWRRGRVTRGLTLLVRGHIVMVGPLRPLRSKVYSLWCNRFFSAVIDVDGGVYNAGSGEAGTALGGLCYPGKADSSSGEAGATETGAAQ